MTNTTKILLIRHGKTDLNSKEGYQGKTDLPLNKDGSAQIRKLKPRLTKLNLEVIFTSPAKRTQKTCKILFKDNQIPIVVHAGLTEIDFGAWEKLTHTQVKKSYPKQLAKWESDPFKHAPTKGETMKIVLNRLSKLYQEILQQYRGKIIALVGHGGSFNILLCHLFGIAAKTKWQFRFSPASLSEIFIYPDNQIVLTLFNDTSHLKEKN